MTPRYGRPGLLLNPWESCSQLPGASRSRSIAKPERPGADHALSAKRPPSGARRYVPISSRRGCPQDMGTNFEPTQAQSTAVATRLVESAAPGPTVRRGQSPRAARGVRAALVLAGSANYGSPLPWPRTTTKVSWAVGPGPDPHRVRLLGSAYPARTWTGSAIDAVAQPSLFRPVPPRRAPVRRTRATS